MESHPRIFNNKSDKPWSACALIFAIPIIASIVIVVTNPNYSSAPAGVVRESPIGSDFVQEWIGGHIVASGQSSRLYDDRWTRELQHDPSLLGFRWDEREYYPMVYPPFYYWLVSPLSRLFLPTAATIWCLLNAIAFSTSLALLAYHLRERLGNWVWIMALGGIFQPLLLSLSMGQKSGFLLLILAASFVLLQRGQKLSSGVVFGLIVFKPHLGLVIGLTMLLKRQYRFAFAAMLPVAAATGISIGMGSEVCRGFWQVGIGAVSYTDNAGYSLAEAHHLWGACKLAIPDSASSFRIVVGLLLGMLIVWSLGSCLRGKIDTRSDKFSLQFSAMILATILLSPHFFTYDLSILLLPMLLVGSSLAPTVAAYGKERKLESAGQSSAQGWVIGIAFVSAGLFATLAITTGISFSVALLCVWLWLLSRELNPRSKTIDSQADGDAYAEKSSGFCRRKTIAATTAPANGPAR